MKLKIRVSNDITHSGFAADEPLEDLPLLKRYNLQQCDVNCPDGDNEAILSGYRDEQCQFPSKEAVDDLFDANDSLNKLDETQKPSGFDIKTMVEAETLAIHRRAFLSPQCVDYPDVVGIKR